MAQARGLLGPLPQEHGAGYQILDGLLGGWVSYPERLRASRQRQGAARGVMQELETMAGGGFQDAPPIDVARQRGGMAPEADAAFQPPQRIDPVPISDPRWGRAALRAQAAGIDISNVLDLLKANQPNVTIAPNGEAINTKDPRVIGRSFPKLGDGMVQARGGVVSNAPGYVGAAAETAGAVTGAQEASKAALDLVEVPQADGSVRKMPRFVAAQMLGGAQRPDGLGVSQTPAARVRAEGLASNDVAQVSQVQNRAASAGRQLDALDNMERLLPDVIAGFGADARLQAARALSALGNKKATNEVAATETFINQGRILVADIIKAFGPNPTEGERKFAEKMSGADADLNPQTLEEGIRLHRARISRDLQAAGKTGRPTAAPDRAAVAAELRRRGLLK